MFTTIKNFLLIFAFFYKNAFCGELSFATEGLFCQVGVHMIYFPFFLKVELNGLVLTLTLTLKRVYFDNNEYCNLRKKKTIFKVHMI